MSATCALVMGALVGLILPISEAGVAFAEATAVAQTPSQQSPPEGSQNPELTEAERPQASEEAADASAPGAQPSPDQAPSVPPSPAPRTLAAPRAAAAPTLTWSARDEDGNLVPGATFTLEGPGVWDYSWSPWRKVVWGSKWSVEDCIGTCGPESMDRDPEAGKFAVDRLGTGTRAPALLTSQRFKLSLAAAPMSYQVQTSHSREVPSQDASPVPSPGAWNNQTYDFGQFDLRKLSFECTAGTVYSLQPKGTLQRLQAGASSYSLTTFGQETAAGNFNALGIGPGGDTGYAVNVRSDLKVHMYDLATQVWKPSGAAISLGATGVSFDSIVAGAVDPSGTYWVGGYGQQRNRFYLWSVDPDGRRATPRGYLEGPEPGAGSLHGDIAFDGRGNLYLTRGVGPALTVFRANVEDLASAASGRGTPLAQPPVFEGAPTSRAIYGGAYGSDGRLFVASKDELVSLERDLAGGAATARRFTGSGLSESQDLASCGYPPTIKLQKDLPAGLAAPTDTFQLELKAGGTSLGSVTTGTPATAGIQGKTLGPIPVGLGTEVTLQETPGPKTAGGPATRLMDYSTTWECTIDGQPFRSGTGAQGKFVLPLEASGQEVLCTFRNTPLKVTKSANVASGAQVGENDIVEYSLTFDNSRGATAVAVDYRDFFADVLDDATFYDPATARRSAVPVVQGPEAVTRTWEASKQWLTLGGSVAAKSKVTLTIPVQVRPNAENAGAREGAASPNGFQLKNVLARGRAESAPTVCESGLCVEHPVSAWTIRKSSLPESGAWLHKGGNAHYKITATKLSAGTSISNLVLTDDLTHVFKTAGWAPDAAVPNGAMAAGVYLFDAAGRTLGLDGRPSAIQPARVRPVAAPQLVNAAPADAPPQMRWLVTSGQPLQVPAQATRVEMWFAVQAAESPAGIPAPEAWAEPGDAPVTGATFVNYATGMATLPNGAAFAPTACAADPRSLPNTGLSPLGASPTDPRFPAQCNVRHTLSKNYFTIRKDAAGVGLGAYADDLILNSTEKWDPDPTGLWNMVGHTFEIRDNDANNAPTPYPSVRLCRTDYDPYAAKNPWRGAWVSAADAADQARWAFGEEGGAIQQKILRWNNEHDTAERLPVCGTLYEISAGAQKGRWRSENLSAGDFWLVETRAPNAQAATDATTVAPRPIPGVQRLAEPVKFKIWPEADGPATGQAMQGRGQLDVADGKNGWLERCSPGDRPGSGTGAPNTGATVAARPTACVNPTGYLMLVKDPVPAPLPLTGGGMLAVVLVGGALVCVTALGAALWRRRRGPRPAARHGA